MITTVLIEHPWLSPTALVVLVVLGPLVGALVADRPRAAWALFGLALLPVVVLTMLPSDRRALQRCEVAWTVPTVARVELAANVVLFVAPALLAVVAFHRRVVVLVAASALAALIEIGQAALPAIGRSCATNDWLSNTIGAVIGVVLGWVALRLASRRRTAASTQP